MCEICNKLVHEITARVQLFLDETDRATDKTPFMPYIEAFELALRAMERGRLSLKECHHLYLLLSEVGSYGQDKEPNNLCETSLNTGKN